MGHVPTHGPDCYKVRSYPIGCKYCGANVMYFECSCGSKVIFVPGDSGEVHSCGSKNRLTRDHLTPGFLVTCERCGIKVRGDRLLNHLERKCKGKPTPIFSRRML